MNIENVIKSLSTLASDTELHHEENWDDSQEVTQWREDAINTINAVVSILTSESNSVGTLNLKGETFLLKSSANSTPSFNLGHVRSILSTLIDDIGLEDEEQWLEKGFTSEWRTNNINAIQFVNQYLSSFSEECVGNIDLNNRTFLVFKTKPL